MHLFSNLCVRKWKIDWDAVIWKPVLHLNVAWWLDSSCLSLGAFQGLPMDGTNGWIETHPSVTLLATPPSFLASWDHLNLESPLCSVPTLESRKWHCAMWQNQAVCASLGHWWSPCETRSDLPCHGVVTLGHVGCSAHFILSERFPALYSQRRQQIWSTQMSTPILDYFCQHALPYVYLS
jgi:hypothetical protein